MSGGLGLCMYKKNLLMMVMIFLTGVISLSTHVFIIQNFQAPNFKINTQFELIIAYIIRWCTVIGALIIFIYSKKYWESISLFYRLILFALLIMALTEQLLRFSIMQIVIGYPWKSQGLLLISTYIGYIILSLLITFYIPIISRTAKGKFFKYFEFSILVTILVVIIKKIANSLTSPLISLIPAVDISKVAHLPYGMKIIIPAYITYLEPVIASFVVFYLIEHKLKNFSTLSKGLIMGGLISLTHAGIFSIVQIINSDGDWIYRLFYYGQFLWEYFTLGILTAFSFYFYRRVRP